MNLATAFAASAERHPDKAALFWGEVEFSYRTLLEQSRWVAATLQLHHRIRPGDRVGLWMKNCPEFVPALFGILLAGGVVTPINNFLKPEEVHYIVADAGIDVLIVDDTQTGALSKLTDLRPSLVFMRVNEMSVPKERPHPVWTPTTGTESDLAVLIYTSGTTGHPKGAMLTHGNLLHNVESCRLMLEAVALDRFVLLLPMFHSFMLTVCILLPLIVGGSIVLIKALHPPKNTLQEIISRGATILPAIPSFFRALCHATVPANLPLRICISGAAPLPLETLRDFEAKFRIALMEGYGLSEASPVVTFNPLRGVRKAGSIGVPIPNVDVNVQDDDGRVLADGQIGEVCVRGGNVMRGYWNQPAETNKVLQNGWLRTGDIGYRDADGYFYITDRKKDMLLVNGINVYPREIEEVIYHFPGVKEAAVVGQPDQRRGEQPVAFIAAQEGVEVDVKALLRFLRERLADYKVPRHIMLMPVLPRNATGKILKTVLRQMDSGSC